MEKEAWNVKYKSLNASHTKEAAALLCENKHLLSGGKALDLAMGMGQNAFFAARHGYQVEGVDTSSVAVNHVRKVAKSSGLSIRTVAADLAHYAIKKDYFDLILNFYFLDRALIASIRNGLKMGGLIFFETYTSEQRQFGRPSNPDYLLESNELLSFFLDLFIVFYHERIERRTTKPKAIASLIAQKV